LNSEEPRLENEAAGIAIGIARDAQARRALLTDRPPGWEFLLFASVLLEGKQGLEPRWRDHQLRLPTAGYHRLSEQEVASYVSEAIGQLSWIVAPLNRVFDASEDAFGKPGEAGDPVLIEHFGGWVVAVYQRLLDWAGTLRSADPPDEFEKALDLTARAADEPLEAVRAFIEETIRKTEDLTEQLARSEAEREPVRLELTLVLTADEGLMQSAIDELKSALGQSE
jgi:hypothetical protein